MLVGLTETGGNTHPDILETYQVSLRWSSLRSVHGPPQKLLSIKQVRPGWDVLSLLLLVCCVTGMGRVPAVCTTITSAAVLCTVLYFSVNNGFLMLLLLIYGILPSSLGIMSKRHRVFSSQSYCHAISFSMSESVMPCSVPVKSAMV